jgi:anthranilate synthase/aminodeoxychorismate synthase-like glutamine amidotransferase
LLRRVLLVDSYDSFTHNIAHSLASQGARLDVLAVDDPRLGPECIRRYDAIVLGPGPGAPREDDGLAQIIAWALVEDRPLLGVCLGIQAIALHYGGRIARTACPVHGELSTIVHDGSGLFAGIPSPFRAMRYHSLCVERATLPAALRISAVSEDGVIQGIRHTALPICGLQFHPESFLSEHCAALLANFLEPVKETALDG